MNGFTNSWRCGAIAVLCSLAFSVDARAQGTQPPGRRQPPAGVAAQGPRYDLTTVTTVDGTLIAVDTVQSMSGIQGTGLHATLKVGKDVLPLHLGPTTYLTQQKVKLVKGDQVHVTGSKVTIATVPSIIAGSIVKGKDTLALRDANGMPLWRGMRRP